MSLATTLTTLQSDPRVTGHRLLGEHKAALDLANGRTIFVYHIGDEKVLAGTIRTIVNDDPRPDFILYDRFELVGDGALIQAHKMDARLVTTRRFLELLSELVAAPPASHDAASVN